MGHVKGDFLKGYVQHQSDFYLSNVELGLLENEVFNEKVENRIELIEFNKLEMILELNKKLFAN